MAARKSIDPASLGNKQRLTTGFVNSLGFLEAGQKLFTDEDLPGFGLRVGKSTKTYTAERRVEGQTVRVTLGTHPLMTPEEARRAAIVVLGKLAAGRNINAERKAADEAARAAEAERVEASTLTLEALCTDYCDWLQASGKSSHVDARNIFTNHVVDAFPKIAAKPARLVEKADVVLMMRRLTEQDKLTTARKLRAYLRAAYTCALHADSDTRLPSSFLAYKVTANPVEGIKAIASATDKNPLPLADLQRYWTALQDVAGVDGAALRLHILTGGQRPAQLVRLTDKDLGETLRLWDAKGKRSKPREHLLPITKAMRAELAKLPAKGFKLSTDAGTTPIHPTTLSAWSADIAQRAGIEDFQLKRVRSGIETALAEAGIPLHTRGLLQSHGLGGVQAASYDAYGYLPEKRKALETLEGLLTRRPAKNVTPMRRRA